jgi:sugar lactone lactonase YvrE
MTRNRAFRLFRPNLLLVLALTMAITAVRPAYAIDRAHYLELRKKAAEKFAQKDWQGAQDVLTEMGRELPGPTPRYMLTVASIEARLGNKAEALQWIEKFVATGLSYDIAKDDDLKNVVAEANGDKLTALMKEHSLPVTGTEFVCELPQTDIMPEDIAYLRPGGSKSAGSFVVSSIQHHTLYRVKLPKAGSRECAMQELPLAAEAKRWPTLAVSADPRRKVLWVTTSAMPGFRGFPKEDEGKALLLEVDPDTGKILHRFDPGTTGPTVLGDMCVTDDGTVYVTDSIGGGVYRLHGDLQTAKLEKIADGLFSPQTPVLAHDGKRLFVADYTMGVAVIDLAAAGPVGKINYLPHPENVAVVALDGMYLSGDSLIGIQNGTEPVRILRLLLNQAQTEITDAQVIEQGVGHDPTHAVAVDGWFYVSANVGWSKVDDSGKLKPGEKFTAPLLVRFRAPSSAK